MEKLWKSALVFFFTCTGLLIISVGAKVSVADSRSDAEAFMSQYLQTFDTGHAREITTLYNDPFYMLSPSGEIKVFEGERKIRKSIRDWKFYMRKDGVASSRYVRLNVRALSSDTALASAEVERADEHGKVRANTGATYTLIRSNGQWKIYLIHLHSREQVLNFK